MIDTAFFQIVFKYGEYIVRQGASGDTFYVISEGKVKVTRRSSQGKTRTNPPVCERGAICLA